MGLPLNKLHNSFSAKNKLCGQLFFFFYCLPELIPVWHILPIAKLSFLMNSYVGPTLFLEQMNQKPQQSSLEHNQGWFLPALWFHLGHLAQCTGKHAVFTLL